MEHVSDVTPMMPERASTGRAPTPFEPTAFLDVAGEGRAILPYHTGDIIFSQDEPADSVMYVRRGIVTLSVVSPRGKEAVIAILGAGDFFGEGCLAGRALRTATARAIAPCSVMRVEKAAMVSALAQRPSLCRKFITYLIAHNLRVEDDLTDQLFNSSEKRLARLLLNLSNTGKDGTLEPVIAKITQQTLADMIGTTRSRVSFFMNKFRRQGFVAYDTGGLRVHHSLSSVIQRD